MYKHEFRGHAYYNSKALSFILMQAPCQFTHVK